LKLILQNFQTSNANLLNLKLNLKLNIQHKKIEGEGEKDGGGMRVEVRFASFLG